MSDRPLRLPNDQKQSYAHIFEQMGDGMVVTTMDGQVVDWNEAAEQMFGYTREEMLGRTPASIIQGADDKLQSVLNDLRENGSWHEIIPFVRKDGSKGYAEAYVRTIVDDHGEPYLTIGANRDITKRIEAENQLHFARGLLERMHEAVHAVRTTDLAIVYVNRSFENVFGYSADEIHGQSVARLNAPSFKDPEERAAEIVEALERDGHWEGEILNVRKNGEEFWSRVRITAHEHPEFGDCWISMHEDVTELRAEEQRRIQLERQLQRSQRLESLGTLASGVAHDFNNILQGIGLSLEAVQAELDDEPPLRETVELGLEFAERGRRVVERILAFARSEPPDIESVDVGELLERTARLIEPLLPSSIEIRTVTPTDALCCLADPADLEQAIVNLCTNASHAMRHTGGRLTLRLWAEEEDWLVFEVKDEGEGIPPEHIGTIFDPFYTTKSPGSGSGLGLTIVHSTIGSLGGTVNATSTVGSGTALRVRLPRVPGGREPSMAEKPDVRSRVMVLDDEAAMLRVLAKLLAKQGIAVVAESNPESALVTLREGKLEIDAILTDQTMPEMSGVEFARQARRLRPEMPILLMSGNIDPRLIDEPDLFVGAIEKPFRFEPLLKTLQGLLEPESSTA